MRNPERLDAFYDELKRIHKQVFPDWRFGQMIVNLERWMQGEGHKDFFYYEEEDFLELLKKFVREVTGDDGTELCN